MAEQKKKAIAKKAHKVVAKKAVTKKVVVKKQAALPAGKAGKKSASKAVSIKKTASPVKAKKATAKKPAKKTATKKPPYKKPKKDEECFLTTACVKYYGLPDDAYELTTLRDFRDTYMATKTKGKKLIKQYYTIAPGIVALINKDKNHKTVYRSVFAFIQKACSEIEKKHFAKAQKTYVALVRSLEERYRLQK